MAGLVNPYKEDMLDGTSPDLTTADVRVMLVLSTYTEDLTDQFLSDLGAVDNGRSAQLTTPSVTDGVFDADNTSLTATAASACDTLVTFIHTGSDATAQILGIHDVTEFTPSASQTVNITWDDGAAKIFAI